MPTGLVRNFRLLLALSLVLAGAVAVSVVPGALSAKPAAAAASSGWTAYVVSYADNAVIPVNTATDAVGAPIAVGSGPAAIAITPDATTAYVADEGTTNTSPGFVTPIDLSTNTAGVPIPVGSGPDAIAITPNGSTAYVGNYNDETVTPVNLATNTAGKPIPIGGSPTSIALSPDGSTAYVGRAFESGITLDLATGVVGPQVPSGFSTAVSPDGSTVVATSPQNNSVSVFDTGTGSGPTVSALNSPQGAAITPDGSTAYVAFDPFTTNKWSLLPIPLADPDATGTPIPLGTSSGDAVAITPDGSTAFVTDLTGGHVVPVDLATGTAGAPISLGSKGTNPIAIAVTPDQAPIAHMHVTILGNMTDSFDATASTVAVGTIASYAWNFGDGTSETTTTPTVTHTYAQGDSYELASVTETNSAGTSTGQVFTGQTASGNGGALATAVATVYVQPDDTEFYPTVSSVSPSTGSAFGPTIVTITGTSFWPGQTEVFVGGVAATSVTVNPDETSLTATLPAQPAGVYDIIVTSATNVGQQQVYFGSNAATTADQFTYSASIPPVSVQCESSTCAIPVVQFGDTSVSSTVSSDCSNCTYTASVTYGVPATGTASDSCPNTMSYAQAQAEVNESESAASNGATLSVDLVNTFLGLGHPNQIVCEDVGSVSDSSSAQTAKSSQGTSAGPALGQDIKLKKCAASPVAPCVQSKAVNGNQVGTTVILPVNESITLTVGPPMEAITTLSPTKVAPGSELTIKGANLAQVSTVVLDADPAGGRLVGGVLAPIVSETSHTLVVTVPQGMSKAKGPVSVVGWSGNVTSSTKVKVT